MENKRVLFISQEIMPYLPETHLSKIGRELPQGIQEQGKEIRVFMPKFGSINERRNQLHEVIRLSGMNLVINDTDHPLIIKVASIQTAKMQVYFIDNDELFKRKHTFTNEDGKLFEDNDERAVFFARGVLETIKKLRWVPDIVHCHGWFASLVPMLIKKSYSHDPLFQDAKIVFSVYDNKFDGSLNSDFQEKAKYVNVEDQDIKHLSEPNFINLNKQAIQHSDAVIYANEDTPSEIKDYVEEMKLPVLNYELKENYTESYSEFYDSLKQ